MHKPVMIGNTPECQDRITLEKVSGQLPSWLNGVMYRVGPGVFNIKQKNGITYTIRHAFDGLPMVHRFQLNGSTQTITYNSRHTAKSLEKEISSGADKGLVFFGHVPEVSFLTWLINWIVRLNNLILRPKPIHLTKPDGKSVGVTVTPNYTLPAGVSMNNGLSKKSLVAKTDANVLQKLHAETLVSELVFSYKDYDPHLNGPFSAAHHQFDPETNELFNFSLHLFPKPKMTVFKTSKEGQTTLLAEITHRKSDHSEFQASYIHSFYLTKNYVIIPESPLVYGDQGLNALLQGAVLSSMRWIDQAPLYFHVIHRNEGGLVASIPAPAFYTFHVANAFEEVSLDGDLLLHLDSSAFSDGDIIYQVRNFGGTFLQDDLSLKRTKFNGFTFPPFQQTSFGHLTRHTLNLNQRTAVFAHILAENIEFPRFHQELIGKPYRFVYGCRIIHDKRSTGLAKVDVSNQSVIQHQESGYEYSEPIFVPHPQAKNEDDGVLLSLANHTECCYLVILNAIDMKELARFKIGQFTAITFHGSFVDYAFKSINLN
ncbi:hypothetical protein G6F62_001532 [Rhizopus arrhizus]|nr:hypothetical protein G6F62_001532 [Rhizopus arrhizus]